MFIVNLFLAVIFESFISNQESDDDIEQAMKNIGFPHWRFRAKVHNLDKNLDNHGISGQKFMILREFLMLGFSPLLSDVDIVTLKNPFDYLERDSDVEGMTDGFDQMAYMNLVVRGWTHNFNPHKDSVCAHARLFDDDFSAHKHVCMVPSA